MKYIRIRLLKERLSFLVELKSLWIIGILLAMTMVAILISAGLGDARVSPLQVANVLLGGGDDFNRLVVLDFRMPRILIALFVGIGLSVAGAILQAMVRNPLASPDIIGITAGASLSVVAFLALFSDENNSLTVSIQWLPVAAFIGALVATILVYVFSWKEGVAPLRLILIGIGISALLDAFKTMFMILGPIYQASQANIWITGTVNGSNWSQVVIIAPIIIALCGIAFFSARHLTVQELGDDVVIGLGNRLQQQRLLLLLVSTALVGTAVAFAGGIGFVGLIAPHMARRIVGSSYGALLPTSAFLGALLVMVADLIGRTLFLPLEVPAGVFTAAIGAPYFIYLLTRSK
ncbi:FecCD family ABC transporter permease [Bacillus fonticola]|uniref:FecCD family ABC transporter permease n=1 Tax=Bacillus fonticola TaxID=2728853 RepID=UPI0014760A04|nr:iron ABC transporter permease [Bacillus fonticola]